MSEIDDNRRASFDQIPELYDQARPRYPEALFDDLISLSGIPPGGRILEIGCGPGTATLPLARRGYQILALELGDNLAVYARQKLGAYANVEVTRAAFEDWDLAAGAFDLVTSATAFHWISPEARYVKTAAALKEGGALGLFWYHSPEVESPFYEAAAAIWHEFLPPGHFPAPASSSQELIDLTVSDIDSSGCYGPVSVRQYHWTLEYTASEYVRLLRTYSLVRNLPSESRREALRRIAELVEKNGGSIERPYSAPLYVARKQKDRPSLAGPVELSMKALTLYTQAPLPPSGASGNRLHIGHAANRCRQSPISETPHRAVQGFAFHSWLANCHHPVHGLPERPHPARSKPRCATSTWYRPQPDQGLPATSRAACGRRNGRTATACTKHDMVNLATSLVPSFPLHEQPLFDGYSVTYP